MNATMCADDTLEPGVSIADDEFRKFRDFFYRQTGMYFDDSKRYFVDKRLSERIAATGSETFRSYFMLLRYDGDRAEMQRLVNAMTVNETYFLREEYQFRCMARHLMSELVATNTPNRPLRIWSLPCSSGEEPYSIAIYLLEHWPGLATHDVEIVGSDIDTEMLRRAQAGIYRKRALQNLSAAQLARHFTRLPNGDYQISADLRQAIRFSRVNLSDARETSQYRDFDRIFCRNLLIYFDDTSRASAAQTIYDALRPGGFVCLGHSESMSRMSTLFAARKFPDAIVYQRA